MVDKQHLEGVRGEFKKVVAGVRGEGLELKERLVGLGEFLFVLFCFFSVVLRYGGFLTDGL